MSLIVFWGIRQSDTCKSNFIEFYGFTCWFNLVLEYPFVTNLHSALYTHYILRGSGSVPGQRECFIYPIVVDQLDLQGPVCVEGEAAAREHQVDLELICCIE